MLARPLSVTMTWPAFCAKACIITVNAPPLLHGTTTSLEPSRSLSASTRSNGSM